MQCEISRPHMEVCHENSPHSPQSSLPRLCSQCHPQEASGRQETDRHVHSLPRSHRGIVRDVPEVHSLQLWQELQSVEGAVMGSPVSAMVVNFYIIWGCGPGNSSI